MPADGVADGHRMLFTNAAVHPGDGPRPKAPPRGVATALIQLGSAAGYGSGRPPRWRQARPGVDAGADAAYETGSTAERVDAVLETVGAATWSHSVNALRPAHHRDLRCDLGRRAGQAELTKIFFKQLRVIQVDHGHP